MFGAKRCSSCGGFCRRDDERCASCRKRAVGLDNLARARHPKRCCQSRGPLELLSFADNGDSSLGDELGLVTPSTAVASPDVGGWSVSSSLDGGEDSAEGVELGGPGEERVTTVQFGDGSSNGNLGVGWNRDSLHDVFVASGMDSEARDSDADDTGAEVEGVGDVFVGTDTDSEVVAPCFSPYGSEEDERSGVSAVGEEGEAGVFGCDFSTDSAQKGVALGEFAAVDSNSDYCYNCHRCRCHGFDNVSVYEVVLVSVPVESINFSLRKWKTVDRLQCADSDEVSLCLSCHAILVEGVEGVVGWELAWPIYCWRLLSSSAIHRSEGLKVLRFLPKQWHGYWAMELCRLYPEVFGSVQAIEAVGAVAVDVTFRRRRMLRTVKELRLGDIKRTYNELLMPLCLCPWGCTSYYKDLGYVDFELMCSRFFPQVELAGVLNSSRRHSGGKLLESCRSDFLCEAIDHHLFNPDWGVHPSVYYKPGFGPVFMTCEQHRKGTREKYFHLPKKPLALPSRFAECLSPAVLRTRTLRTSMPKKYSNGYRLQKCTATYCGIDTALVSETRHFDYLSHVDDLSEARSYFYRDDIKGLAQGLVSKGELPQEYVDNLEERSGLLHGSCNRFASCGATMMTLRDAVKLQKALCTSLTRSVSVGVSGKVQEFRQNWPSYMLGVHSNDRYGSAMYAVPKMGAAPGGDRAIQQRQATFWVVCCLIVTVPEVWEGVDASVQHASSWQGYLLSFLSRKVMENSVSSDKRRNPFFVHKAEELMKSGGLSKKLIRDDLDCLGNVQRILAVCGGGSIAAVVTFAGISRIPCTIGTVDTEFILLENVDAGGCPPMDVIVESGAKFELRFVALKEANQLLAWRRHGGIFDWWWVTTRGGPTRREEAFEFRASMQFLCALYVKEETVSACDYRRAYLKYIGGQNVAYCRQHDVPLVTSAVARLRDGAKVCCFAADGGVCGSVAAFDCPVVSCSAAICKKCQASFGEQVTYVTPVGGYQLSGSDAPEFEENTEENAKTRKEQSSFDNEDEDSGYASTSGESDSDCGREFDHLHTGCDVPMFDVEHCAVEREEEVDAGDGIIPTTQAGAKPDLFSGGLDTMGTSVLLNKFGTILVRRDNRLQASRREQNITERVVARSTGECIPLVYLEGMLFPSIFWSHPHSSKGGLLGSMPTALFCQHSTRKRFEVASLASHAKVRLKSIGNAACSNPSYLSFLFDCLANGALEGEDTRVVLSRGFEESMGPAGMRMRNKDDDFYTDTIDNRQNCHNLCASEREKRNSVFVTFTCNQLLHFGTKIVKQYVDSPAALENYKQARKLLFPGEPLLSVQEEAEVCFALQEAARNLLVRNWMEVRLVLIRYLLKSPEKPIGEVQRIFVRDEYQSETGNLSHLHMLLTLREDYKTRAGRQLLQGLIRGFVDGIVGLDEVEELVREGVLEDWDDYWAMKEQAGKILAHHCDSYRCMRRVGPGSSELVCRVPDPRKLSLDLTSFFEKKHDVQHSAEALRLYEKLGFCEIQAHNGGNFVPLVGFLDPTRIVPPARFGEGNISPVVGRLFAATRSSMNVQVCTTFGTSRYLVKYLTNIDKNNYVAFSAKQGEAGTHHAQLVRLHNTKITSSAFSEKVKLNKSRDKARPRGRAVASTEMQQIMLGYPQVHTNVEYIKVPSLPMGDRCGLERKTPRDRYEEALASGKLGDGCKVPDITEYCLPWLNCREDFFQGRRFGWRRFTSSQAVILGDQLDLPVSLDRVTLFGVRPPELLLVDKMEWYYKMFSIVSMLPADLDRLGGVREAFKVLVASELSSSAWIDGLGAIVKLRVNAIPSLEDILPVIRDRWGTTEHQPMLKLFELVCRLYNKEQEGLLTRGEEIQWKRMRAAFIDSSCQAQVLLPVPVFSNVRPKNATKFVVHLLLSMGHFETESDLWCNLNAKDALFRAGLLRVKSANEISEDTCLELLKFWMEDQCQYYPISTRTMDDYACSAYSIIKGVLLSDELPSDDIPPCLYTRLRSETDCKMMENRRMRRETVVKATLAGLERVYGANSRVLPTLDEVMDGVRTPFGRTLVFPRSSSQSVESYEEQSRVFRVCKNTVEAYRTPSIVATRSLLIVGPPGAGKTHCMLHAVLYCCCQGLLCVTTAILAERALLLGGQHVHLLFKLRVRDSGYRVHRMAELAVVALQKHPEQLNFLRSLDVLFVDEVGQLSAELLSVLDIVMRRIRDSSTFMGGLLLIGTLDQVQLRPIKELPFLLSPYVMTCFSMTRLKHYVRCADCLDLQQLNELARFFTSDEVEREAKAQQFVDMIAEKCQFYDSWDDSRIDDLVLRIFPRKKQVGQAVEQFLVSKRKEVEDRGGDYLWSRAEDTMVALESHGEWSPASGPVVLQLNRDSSEPKQLDFFVGAVYQFTFNHPKRFSTTQLAVLVDMPKEEDLLAFKPVRVWAAPPGTKIADVGACSKEDLAALRWKEVDVGIAREVSHTVWRHGVKAKRKQYGLKHHIASTVHSAIGHTMHKVATELSPRNGVWERAMVVVLISRVKRARDIIFVGNKDDNLRALKHGITLRSQYDDFMNHVVDVLSGKTPNRRIAMATHYPFRPKDIRLPSDSSGCVYLLVSTKNGRSLYVGMTQNLLLRLKQHNSGYGSESTAPPELRAWALVAYVSGFDGDRSLMRSFEADWQATNYYRRPSVEDSITRGETLARSDRYAEHSLVLVDQYTDYHSINEP